jgi:hypothetical protein
LMPKQRKRFFLEELSAACGPQPKTVSTRSASD